MLLYSRSCTSTSVYRVKVKEQQGLLRFDLLYLLERAWDHLLPTLLRLRLVYFT